MQNKFVILIVDDNTNFVNRMVGLLSDTQHHWEIKTATNYDQALQLMLSSDPNVFLLDINLPGKNGIEILRYIKRSGNSGEVIMITNHADEYYKEQCRQLGATYFLDKSYDFALIPGIIYEFEKKQLDKSFC